MNLVATVEIEIADPKSSMEDICGFIFAELSKFTPFLPEGNFVSMISYEIQEVDDFE
jgi:hypothetical protein